ncbi:cold-shock protein [Candidatus Peribacteria bacterium]|nr:cold-shock protein [Candidatus Peribacteria bacterium]
MASGIIKKILEKGFGFISVEGMEDVFFHMSACNGQFESLREGQSVQFEVEDGPKGKKAVNVTAI